MSNNVPIFTKLIPDEVISEFLIRLPVKDVHRFKSVSKTWYSIINTPYFITSYINRTTPSFYFFERTIHFTTTTTTATGPLAKFKLTPRPRVSTLTVNHGLLVSTEGVPVLDNDEYPAQLLQSSNGLILFDVAILASPNYAFFKEALDGFVYPDHTLFLANPVTGECVRIPKTDYLPVDMRFGVGFASRLDPGTGNVGRFVVVEYQQRETGIVLQCFSSDTGKWVVKKAKHVFPPPDEHHFRPDWPFEFDGRLFWVEFSVGLITWDFKGGDIFTDCETGGEAECRLIPLPKGRERSVTTTEMVRERRFGGVESGGRQGRCLQYVELFNKGDHVLKCWRLKYYMNPNSKWSLVYKVPRFGFDKRLDFKKVMMFNLHPPFEPDSVFFYTGKRVLSFNFRTRKVENCAKMNGDCGEFEFMTFVLPRWPISIPPRLYAAYAKEEGNGYFKKAHFIKAIECYTKSIALSPNVIAYANRAMVYLKINDFQAAEDDCTHALKLDNKYFKGYARRAMARKELGNLEGSKEDAETALKLEPSDRGVKNLYAEVKSLLDKASTGGRRM